MITEKGLAMAMGLPRKALKGLRDNGTLSELEHWEKTQEGIVYTPDGIDRLREISKNSSEVDFSLDAESFEKALEGYGVEEDAPRIVKVSISRIWPGNPKRMECEYENEKFVLCVRTTDHFKKGMEVDALLTPGLRLMHYRGRYPRQGGRF